MFISKLQKKVEYVRYEAVQKNVFNELLSNPFFNVSFDISIILINIIISIICVYIKCGLHFFLNTLYYNNFTPVFNVSTKIIYLDFLHPTKDVQHLLKDFVQIVCVFKTHSPSSQQLQQVVPETQHIVFSDTKGIVLSCTFILANYIEKMLILIQ